MLKKQNRLTSKFEFNVTKKYGKKFSAKFFNLYYLDAKNYEGEPKFGIVVPNTFSKSAPQRNRAKRLLREVVRLNLEGFKNGYWIVIFPKDSIKDTKYEEISTEFNKVLSEIFISR